jgi:hypothetical protein
VLAVALRDQPQLAARLRVSGAFGLHPRSLLGKMMANSTNRDVGLTDQVDDQAPLADSCP